MSIGLEKQSIQGALSSNPTLYSHSQEPYTKCGLTHFLKKFGLSSTINPRDANIHIGYTRYDIQNGMQIILNTSVQEEVCCLCTSGSTIPLFKRPVKTEGEDCLATAKYGGENYACISISGNKITIGFDIFAEIGRILSGHYDKYFLNKDKLGMSLKAIPVVDVLEECLFTAMKNVMPDLGSKKGFTWPDGRNFAMVLTHDVDRVYKTHQYLRSILNSVKKADLPGLSYHLNNLLFKHGINDPYWTFEKLCTLERSLGVKSTYYFLNETGRLNPFKLKSWILYTGHYDINMPAIIRIIQELDNMGFEIGVHGSYNSYCNPDLLLAEKRTIESITGKRLTGIRQHYLNYNNSITPQIHYNCGFNYDTSVGFKPAQGIGFRRGTSFPFQVMLPDMSVAPLVEIPLIIMDTAIGRTATDKDCFHLIDQIEKYNGVLTILWHQNTINKKESPALVNLYKEIVKEAQRRGAWVATAKEVSDWVIKSN